MAPSTTRPPQPGQPTPQQIQAMQQQLAAEAAKHNMSVEQYVAQLKAQALRQHQLQQAQKGQQAGGHQHAHDHDHENQHHEAQSQVPINPGPPNPAAIALAKFLRSQNLKPRTFKRALRALESPNYAAARKKNPLLPEITDRLSLENTFKLLPLSLLALRVSKIDPHEGHGHEKSKKRIKGQWTVKIEQQQEVGDDLHFIWLYEGSQIMQKVYAGIALVLIFAVVMFPLWPMKLRMGVWYLSMGMMGLIALFFAMAIFRLILFAVTIFAVPPGLWLYPNLFEDVGFFDSFRPVWGWQEDAKAKKGKKGKKSSSSSSTGNGVLSINPMAPTAAAQATTTSGVQMAIPTAGNNPMKRDLTPRVEEVDDSD
ncbi:MAG: Translocation protein S62 [Trizodia sp. TS-e1964]|nr:MAG: Translocation protein S62 [Trizodia sp. TS-e1964]